MKLGQAVRGAAGTRGSLVANDGCIGEARGHATARLSIKTSRAEQGRNAEIRTSMRLLGIVCYDANRIDRPMYSALSSGTLPAARSIGENRPITPYAVANKYQNKPRREARLPHSYPIPRTVQTQPQQHVSPPRGRCKVCNEMHKPVSKVSRTDKSSETKSHRDMFSQTCTQRAVPILMHRTQCSILNTSSVHASPIPSLPFHGLRNFCLFPYRLLNR